MNLEVVLVHYHTPELLHAAVISTLQDMARSGLTGRVTVVDNGSNENDKEILSSLPVRYLNPGVNLGYAGAINLALDFTNADVAIVMNSDLELFPGCIENLVRAIASGASAAGPRFYWDRDARIMLPPTEPRGWFDEFARRASTLSPQIQESVRKRWRTHARRHWMATRSIESFALSGAMIAMSGQAWRVIGPFDDSYKLYFEENDWLARLERAGGRAVYVPSAQVLHYYNQSAVKSPRAREWFNQSARRYEKRHYKKWQRLILDSVPKQRPTVDEDDSAPSATIDDINAMMRDFIDGKVHAIELSPSPSRFPATASFLSPGESWSLPHEMNEYLSSGKYHITSLDAAGDELFSQSFNLLTGEAAMKRSESCQKVN